MNDVTLEQLMTAIKMWNLMNAPSCKGKSTYDMGDIVAGASLFGDEKTVWEMVRTGALVGSRYTMTPHGFVVQAPQPINEMSLIPVETGKMLGLG